MNVKTIGVIASGGDSSGMNAALRAVVRMAVNNNFKVKGIYGGYQGLIEDNIKEFSSRDVSGIIHEGGVIIFSGRSDDFKSYDGRCKAVENMKKHSIDALVVIGGDGSFKGLSILINEHKIIGIGIPGTIDNDLYGTDWTIGFDTAVNVAVEAIDRLRDTATSHDRLFIVEVMGRSAGYIALYSGLASGSEAILIPETPTDLDRVCKILQEGKLKGKRSSIIVVAEGDESGGAFSIADKIKNKTGWDTRVSVLGHIQRGGRPTAFDRIIASRMGVAAVKSIMEGKNNVMVGIINDQIVYTPLQDAIEKKKNPNPSYLETAEILSQ